MDEMVNFIDNKNIISDKATRNKRRLSIRDDIIK